MSSLSDLSGQRFGLLVVKARGINSLGGKARWLCQCDCGGVACSTGYDLKAGKSTNCGCVRKAKAIEKLATHRKTHTLAYRRWTDMKSRIKRSPYYANVKCCERWLSFDNFYSDMGECPEGFSLERIDNTGNYEPANCKWIPRREQGRNTRRTIAFEWNGRKYTVADWCRVLGLKQFTVYSRIRKGWSIPQALGLVPRKQNEQGCH